VGAPQRSIDLVPAATNHLMAETYDDWTLYAEHRAHFTEAVLSSSAQPGGRVCVLGAGRCNDVDLERLALAFSEIHLVDLDATALGAAVARQTSAVRARLRPHARVDLSGLTKRLVKWKRKPPTVAQIEASADATLQAIVSQLPGPFDVVVSACVLTQMSFAVRDALGDAHPMLSLVRLSAIATHLNVLLGLTRAGGASLFVSDLTSSSAFPVETMRASRDPRELMDRIVASGAAYHSANPSVIGAILAQDSLRAHIAEPELLDPWLWTGRMGRTYFVYALRIPRRAA
jgi:hypothetical protein